MQKYEPQKSTIYVIFMTRVRPDLGHRTIHGEKRNKKIITRNKTSISSYINWIKYMVKT